MIQIYTGNGKGKTTAALGQALRATGHGLKVLMIQFMKGQINYGELEAAKHLPLLAIEQYGRAEFVNPEHPEEIDRDLAHKAMRRAQKAVQDKTYDMVILDEINVAVHFGLIPVDEVITLLRTVPQDIDVILTGRYMPEQFAEHADMISDVREVKHHFHDGESARQGIEY
ncbi:MAG: cob(I)yrinic acid a,c-diamide adenosyltransferase [candidate division WOR-3 bacterium]|nr:MAG: cob(I)yrinic acid a,c-diamide adenosyltransferase [candidate division WOR-3 bacterium]